MEDKFEKFVNENSDEFDFLEVPEGAWEAIQQKRGKAEKPKTRVFVLSALRRVAAVFVIALAGYGLYSIATNGSGGSQMVSDLPAEIREMDQYYESQISQSLDELTEQYPDNELVAEEVSVELDVLKEEKEKLLEELKKNFSNQKILEELIQVYRLRLEMLEDVLKTLNEEHEKEYKNENDFNT